MNKRTVLMMLCFLPILLRAQSIDGRIVDEQAQPMPFANAVLLNRADSAFIQGVVTKDDGTFSIPTDRQDGLLKVSSVGYTTRYMDARQGNMGDIRMQPDNQMLGEVVVKGRVPAYKLTTGGIQTNVENTVLSKLGTGEDVLSHVPGITRKQNGFEVFGKGSPLIYINGRVMRDASELDQLKSEDIKSIELITSPGARYDASVKAVVKIRTKAVQGEGFGFDARSSYYQSENTDLVEQLNWNYRHGRLDIFGNFRYDLSNSDNPSNTTTLVQADTLWRQNFSQDFKPKEQISKNTIGVNYQFDNDNSAGVRYTLALRPDTKNNTSLRSEVTADGDYYDLLDNTIHANVDYRPAHQLNVYYKGKLGKTEIDFNTDYLYDRQSDHTVNTELSESKDDRTVNSENTERNELVASKLTATHPLFGGSLTVGAEYTHTDRTDNYVNPEQYVPTSYARLKESHIAPFIEYGLQLSCLQLTAGLRYEWVDFNYYEDGRLIDTQSRSFGDLFPSLTVGAQLGEEAQVQLSYTAKTRRPSYEQLSNNVTYGNRFLLQSGNPLLDQEYVHDLSLMGVWKFLQATVGYNDRRDAIIYWAEQLPGNTSVTRVTYKNIPTLKSLSAQIAAAPKFGIWSPELSIGMQKQWLTLHTDAGDYRLNDPVFQFSLTNVLDFGHGWVASADAYLTTKGHSENNYLVRNTGSVNVSLTKSMLNDRLSIRIQGNDLFHTEKQGERMYAGLMQSTQISWYDSREFAITLRYKFNTTRSKYRGTGAGNEEKGRL